MSLETEDGYEYFNLEFLKLRLENFYVWRLAYLITWLYGTENGSTGGPGHVQFDDFNYDIDLKELPEGSDEYSGVGHWFKNDQEIRLWKELYDLWNNSNEDDRIIALSIRETLEGRRCIKTISEKILMYSRSVIIGCD